MAKQLPASASEIAHVAEVAGQLGIRTEDVLGFTRTMIDMGESTNLSASDAAAAIAKIANITGMTSSEYQRFGSAVVALVITLQQQNQILWK
ncbi:phage protein [Streptococcus pseudoporcinus]|uniref:Phage protein n=1 Tax=Streptococcus pseudoporcinus TaxID=361101 RepID=A0A4U9YY47_9STRE|nr:phage protein [Streptococcus pseudoporcinus]